jgi:hypothetical protein
VSRIVPATVLGRGGGSSVKLVPIIVLWHLSLPVHRVRRGSPRYAMVPLMMIPVPVQQDRQDDLLPHDELWRESCTRLRGHRHLLRSIVSNRIGSRAARPTSHHLLTLQVLDRMESTEIHMDSGRCGSFSESIYWCHLQTLQGPRETMQPHIQAMRQGMEHWHTISLTLEPKHCRRAGIDKFYTSSTDAC